MEGGGDRFRLLAIVKKYSNLFFFGWSHQNFHYVWYCVYHSVCLSFVLKSLEPIKKCPHAMLWDFSYEKYHV